MYNPDKVEGTPYIYAINWEFLIINPVVSENNMKLLDVFY